MEPEQTDPNNPTGPSGPADPTGPTIAPPRLFRLTRLQLDNTAKSVLAPLVGPQAAALLPRDPLQTNYEYAANLTFNSANFTPFATWASGWAELVRSNPRSVIDCTSTDTTCLQTKATALLTKAFRGSATPAVMTAAVQYYLNSVTADGFAEATVSLVDVALTSPSFAFRDEVRTDANNALLAPLQLQNVSYTLADVPPEATGVNTNQTRDELVRQILDTPKAREKLARFFSSWLEIKEPTEFTLAATTYPDFTPQVAAAAVQETLKFLQYQATQPSPSLRAITESTQSFVPAALAPFYDLSPANLTGDRLVDLDATQRRGLFTQAAVLASHSGPTTTRLVKRGVFFTRKVMCLEMGTPPPGTIPSTLPEGNTERERIESATNSQAKCQGCHQYINPFGFMLENYDATGRWRTTDEGHPINSKINVSFLEEGPFEANTPIEALTHFTNSSRFKQCFVRQLFRYYMGRNEIAADTPVLRAMFTHLSTHDEQSLVPLLQILATSDSMTQRKETP